MYFFPGIWTGAFFCPLILKLMHPGSRQEHGCRKRYPLPLLCSTWAAHTFIGGERRYLAQNGVSKNLTDAGDVIRPKMGLRRDILPK
jgi:hypothetical protein